MQFKDQDPFQPTQLSSIWLIRCYHFRQVLFDLSGATTSVLFDLSGATTSGKSGPGSDDNEEVLRIPQNSPSDYLV